MSPKIPGLYIIKRRIVTAAHEAQEAVDRARNSLPKDITQGHLPVEIQMEAARAYAAWQAWGMLAMDENGNLHPLDKLNEMDDEEFFACVVHGREELLRELAAPVSITGRYQGMDDAHTNLRHEANRMVLTETRKVVTDNATGRRLYDGTR